MMDENAQVLQFRSQIKNIVQGIISDFDEEDLIRLENDDMYVLCFIHWRKGDVEAAVKLATDVLRWRKEKHIGKLKPEDFETKFLERGIIFVHGKAKDDTILVHFITRQQTKDMKPQVQKLLSLWLESIQRNHPGKHITFLLDVSKSSLANVDVGGIRFMLDCFTTYFPDMLEKILILEMPWIMNAIWKVVKQWMTEEQRKRTVFCSFKDITQYIEPEQLLEYMGGTDCWKYTYPPFSDSAYVMKQNKPAANSTYFTQGDDVDASSEEEDKEFVVNNLEITSTSEVVEVPPIAKRGNQMSREKMFNTEIPVTDKLYSNQTPCDLKQTADSNTTHSAEKTHPSECLNHIKSESTAIVCSVTDTGSSADVAVTEKNVQKTLAAPRSTSNELKLGQMLVMSPVAEVPFKHNVKDAFSGRYQAHITLTNPNSESIDYVAFKVKTNAPERYHVKPSAGKVAPDETVVIRINLATGHERSVSRDRFLILYQRIDSDVDVTEFWACHTSKESRFEHRIRVRFEADALHEPVPTERVIPTTPATVATSTANPASASTNVNLEPLRNEISQLRYQLRQINLCNQHLRVRLRYSFFIQVVLVILLLYTVYKVSLLTRAAGIGLFHM